MTPEQEAAIRSRHEKAATCTLPITLHEDWSDRYAVDAHKDRAALLAALDQMRERERALVDDMRRQRDGDANLISSLEHDAADARESRLRSTLRLCSGRFRDYVRTHTENGALDKAQRNAEMVEMIEAALRETKREGIV